MDDIICDVAIVGAGTAGLAAERSARAAGARTCLIDDRFAGTTCATVGCMPSKLLIAAAGAAEDVRRAGIFGIGVPAPVIDGAAVLARVRRKRDAFAAASRETIAALPDGVTVRATARFAGETSLVLDDGRRVTARAVVIATGSCAALPPQFAALGALALTNETLFDLDDLPASVAVVGAGSLGLELAQALARLDVDVAVFEAADALKVKDAPVAEALLAILRRALPVHLGVEVEAERHGAGVRVRWHGASSGERDFARVLVATGRPPQLDRLDPAAAGLTLDEHGVPCFDRATLQCGSAPVFIAGDADADRPVLHEASTEGAIAGRNAACYPEVTPGRRTLPFTLMFTDPPLAVLGRPPGDDLVTGCASYADQGRAKMMARNEGLVRLHAAPDDGRLLGASLLCPGADHLAHLIAAAIERGDTASDLLALPFYHPTLEEGLRPALREICSAVHAPQPPDRDAGLPPGA